MSTKSLIWHRYSTSEIGLNSNRGFKMLLNEYLTLKLETIRKQKKIKVYDLCKRACISYETYRSIRKIKNKDIYFRTLLILIRALDVKPSEFFDDAFVSDDVDIDFK